MNAVISFYFFDLTTQCVPHQCALFYGCLSSPSFLYVCQFCHFSRELMYNVSVAVSHEVRAFYNDDVKHGIYGRHGLSCFSPVINIMRHPLWGRNQVCVSDLRLDIVV